ncbi:hypothetical protein [Pseudoalteromonas sp. B530]|uniref:hypothetical protein n=1 Tax=Pseudoalteromonas sp. B530 TaxID=2994390 RepID=UPI00224AEC01|nr:hypothetical protein [Pseudoalteromonas sp. B530]MCX2767870.1 hypothetical protein [Pseudoalteromonas sp. B530]
MGAKVTELLFAKVNWIKGQNMKGSELVPISLPMEAGLSDNEKKEFTKKRKSLLSELRCITGLPELASNLNQDTVYKLVLAPEGGKLYQDAQGNLKGVFYKDGKIAEHAKFQEIGPSLLKAAKAVGTQVLLVSIAMQLNRIEALVAKVFTELHGDRLAEIEAGHTLFNQACGMQSSEKREQLTLQAIPELTRGFEKTVSALKRQILELPEQELSFFDNWIGNKSEEAQEKHQMAMESFSGCLKALKTIARCFIFLNERDVALSVINDGLSKVEKAGVDTAIARSRLVPKVKGVFPEESWSQFKEYRNLISNDYMNELMLPTAEVIELELRPSELLEQEHVTV